MSTAKQPDEVIDALTQLARSEHKEDVARASERVKRAVGDELPGYEALLEQLSLRATEISRLRALADSDELTGLANRRGFMHALERSISELSRREGCHSILLLDLDDLKPLNDLHGHQAGDEALRRLAAACVKNARASDLVARLGGDEFGILLSNTNASGAIRAAVRYRSDIEACTVRGQPLRVSIGLATITDGRLDAARALASADAALYQDKRNRKKRRLSDPPLAA